MYIVTKELEVSGSHTLNLPYESKCTNLHGHNWKITVTCASKTLNQEGMVVDFVKIKEIVSQLDHTNINCVLGDINPTAENIARWICEKVPFCIKVIVQESDGNIAMYEADSYGK